MKVGFERGLSDRELAGRRELREFQAEEARRDRETEDRAAYQSYLDTLAAEQERIPKAYQLEPVSWEEFRSNMPDESDQAVRGLVAARNVLTKQHVAHYRSKVASESLTDDDLLELGFDLSKRPADGSEVDAVFLRQAYSSFQAVQKEYSHDAHFDALSRFVDTYHLAPTFRNLQGGFSVLWHLGLVQPAAPKPAPDPSLNRHGVNLRIAPNPEVEREQARKRYREEVVIVDPRDGKGFTQYQLDNCVDADTYKRLVIGSKTLTIADVIKPGLK